MSVPIRKKRDVAPVSPHSKLTVTASWISHCYAGGALMPSDFHEQLITGAEIALGGEESPMQQAQAA
jgi:hypothetical protein